MTANKGEYLPKTWSDWSPSRLFRTDGGITAIIGRLLTIREADMVAHPGIDHRILSRLIVGWVNGQSLADLAGLVPNKRNKPDEDHLTDVARLVFRNVARTTSWGLGAAQGLAIARVFPNRTTRSPAPGTGS